MKTRKSTLFFTILGKDITRYSLIWILYSIFLGLAVLLAWGTAGSAPRLANYITALYRVMGFVNFLYAPIVAIFLFGDLFDYRKVETLHALPMRREGWFLAHLTAGVLFFLPNIIAALVCAQLLQQYYQLAFLWLAIMALQYLFFFGLALLSIQLAGNRLGSVTVYGILNFLGEVIFWLFTTFYAPLLRGIKLNTKGLPSFSPVTQFWNTTFMDTFYDETKDATFLENAFPEHWIYLGIAAGVGLVLLVVSLVLFRKRRLECAEDLLAFRPTAPVFLVLFSLCSSAALYKMVILGAHYVKYPLLFIGSTVGFFTGWMLLEQRPRVFRGQTLRDYGIFVGALLITLGLTSLDPVGFTRHIPKADQIVSVRLNGAQTDLYVESDSNGLVLTDPEHIAVVQDIHKTCIDNPISEKTVLEHHNAIALYFCYQLKDGSSMERYYYLATADPAMDTVRSYLTSTAAVFQGEDPQQLQSSMQMLTVCFYNHNRELVVLPENYVDLEIYDHYKAYKKNYGSPIRLYTFGSEETAGDIPLVSDLFQAIEADCSAGNMIQNSYLHGVYYTKDMCARVTVYYPSSDGIKKLTFTIFNDSENAAAYLNTLLSELP